MTVRHIKRRCRRCLRAGPERGFDLLAELRSEFDQAVGDCEVRRRHRCRTVLERTNLLLLQAQGD